MQSTQRATANHSNKRDIEEMLGSDADEHSETHEEGQIDEAVEAVTAQANAANFEDVHEEGNSDVDAQSNSSKVFNGYFIAQFHVASALS